MIIGVGCDIVDHDVTSQLNWADDTTLLERYFSRKEIELYNSRPSVKFIAGRFAAKEAVLKCISLGMQDGISLSHIEILQSIYGGPTLILHGSLIDICKDLKITNWHLSITHSTKYSFAFIVAESM